MELEGVIVGGLIGVAGGVVGPLVVEAYRRCADSRSLGRAIAGEISSVLNIVERRRYVEDLRQLIESVRSGAVTDPTSAGWFIFPVRFNYFPVYEANVSRVGTLRGQLPKLVATFYAQAHSILEDIHMMSGGIWYGPQALDELLALFENTAELGRQIMKAVEGGK